jgi:predicted DNA-binding transcriptional regulator YafY
MTESNKEKFLKAVACKNLIQFEYYKPNESGNITEKREGEPYAMYWNENEQNYYVDIRQTDGFSYSNDDGFRTFEANFIKNIKILDSNFEIHEDYEEQSKRYEYPYIKILIVID